MPPSSPPRRASTRVSGPGRVAGQRQPWSRSRLSAAVLISRGPRPRPGVSEHRPAADGHLDERTGPGGAAAPVVHLAAQHQPALAVQPEPRGVGGGRRRAGSAGGDHVDGAAGDLVLADHGQRVVRHQQRHAAGLRRSTGARVGQGHAARRRREGAVGADGGAAAGLVVDVDDLAGGAAPASRRRRTGPRCTTSWPPRRPAWSSSRRASGAMTGRAPCMLAEGSAGSAERCGPARRAARRR